MYTYAYDDKQTSTEINDDLYPLSGVKILLDFRKLTKTKKYTITLAEGTASYVKAYLYQSRTKVADFTAKMANVVVTPIGIDGVDRG